MTFSSALTRWSDHILWIRQLQKRYEITAHERISLDILEKMYPHQNYEIFYLYLFKTLLTGIEFFPRKEYWQYPYIFSPHPIKPEPDSNWYENIFFWEKEEVLELLGIDPALLTEPAHRFPPRHSREAVDMMYGVYTLTEKKIIRHVPDVYVAIYADGSANICDNNLNEISLPGISLTTGRYNEIFYTATVEFLHLSSVFHAEIGKSTFPVCSRIRVYDIINSDLEV